MLYIQEDNTGADECNRLGVKAKRVSYSTTIARHRSIAARTICISMNSYCGKFPRHLLDISILEFLVIDAAISGQNK
jgi:hypothetical protein